MKVISQDDYCLHHLCQWISNPTVLPGTRFRDRKPVFQENTIEDKQLKFVSSNPAHDKVYSILVTLCDKVCQWLATGRCFSPGTRIPPPIKLTTGYIWNIVESGVKHHSSNPNLIWLDIDHTGKSFISKKKNWN